MSGRISGLGPSVPVGPNGESYEEMQAARLGPIADPRNWQQKARDWLNEQGQYLLGPHGDALFSAGALASEFTDAADLRDAMQYGGKMGGAVERGDWWEAAGAAPWMLMASGAAMLPGAMGAVDDVADAARATEKTASAVEDVPKVGKISGIRVYRGAPPNSELKPIDFGGVFSSTNPETAKQYGEVSEYIIPSGTKLLDMNDLSPEGNAASLIRGYVAGLGEAVPMTPESMDEWAAELHMLANYEDWPDFVKSLGYQGTKFGEDILVYDPSLMEKAKR